MPTSKTPLMTFLRQAWRLAAAANKSDSTPADELIDQLNDVRSRRAFLRSSGQMALMAGGISALNACRTTIDPIAPTQAGAGRIGTNTPSVAIVGGGIAGLMAAHTFTKKGFTNFTIYEASARTGGRIYTAKNIMAPGLTTELGGEFIDSGHQDMLNLAQEFGLTLLDTQASSEQALIKDAYYFNGRQYALAEVVAAFRTIASRMEADINSLPDTIDYTTTGVARQLDQLSISAYLSRIGATGLIKELLEVAYETEYGLAADQQSCINLLFLISTDTRGGKFDIFGDSDERYKIAGGNQQITDRLTNLYQDSIETGCVLQAINQSGSKIELRFANAPAVRADFVLLTLPFTKLRQVDINVSLPAVKKNSINKLGYGTNAKLMLGFSSRPWRSLGYSGYVFSDNGLQSGWDNSQLQGGSNGGYTVYLGGSRGSQLGTGSVQSKAIQYLPLLNQIFPGAVLRYNGNAERFHWPTHPYTLGSYACYKTGQWTSIGGAETEPVGQLFFAGEHCSADYQGYMNGGAETGRKAARAIWQLIKA